MAEDVEVRRIVGDDLDSEVVEEWERVVGQGEFERRGVEASLHPFAEWQWSVGVAAMEFVRDESLESELRAAVATALSAVPGVAAVDEEDREVWQVDGTPSGPELVRAVAAAIDRFVPRFDF